MKIVDKRVEMVPILDISQGYCFECDGQFWRRVDDEARGYIIIFRAEDLATGKIVGFTNEDQFVKPIDTEVHIKRRGVEGE